MHQGMIQYVPGKTGVDSLIYYWELGYINLDTLMNPLLNCGWSIYPNIRIDPFHSEAYCLSEHRTAQHLSIEIAIFLGYTWYTIPHFQTQAVPYLLILVTIPNTP